MNKTEYPYAYMHFDGCKKEAFYLSKMPYLGEPIKANNCINIDGSFPVAQQNIICGTCKEWFKPRLMISYIMKR